MRCHGAIRVDPKDLRVNIRYLSNSTLPKVVREAMRQVKEQVADLAAKQKWQEVPQSRLGGSFIFVMNDRRADLDGPSKRTLDAISDGLRVNDSRFDELHFYRSIGEPRIDFDIWTIGDDSVEKEPDADWYLVPGSNFVHIRSESRGKHDAKADC